MSPIRDALESYTMLYNPHRPGSGQRKTRHWGGYWWAGEVGLCGATRRSVALVIYPDK